MEGLFLKMISQLNKTGQESFGLKETVDLYKTRSKPGQDLRVNPF